MCAYILEIPTVNPYINMSILNIPCSFISSCINVLSYTFHTLNLHQPYEQAACLCSCRVIGIIHDNSHTLRIVLQTPSVHYPVTCSIASMASDSQYMDDG